MNKTTYLFCVLILCSTSLFSQVGGGSTYAFLNVPASARVAALGGTFMSAKDDDLNCALQNPSLLNPEMDHQLILNGVLYFDGVKFGDAGYARDFKKYGTFMANMHFASYGQLLETDVAGQILGTFHAADYNLNLGWGYKMNKLFSVGASLKGIYSDYYIYKSFGLGADLGATLYEPISQFTASIVAKNIGVQLKNYVEDDKESLPLEVDIAISKRLTHTPLRFNLTYRHLEKFDLTYVDALDVSEVDILTGKPQLKTYDFFNKLSRHLILAAEILLSKNFHLRAGYNFQRRHELGLDSGSGLTGFSFGFGIKISKFNIGYGRATYHLAGAANHFSVSVRLSDFIKKRSSPSE